MQTKHTPTPWEVGGPWPSVSVIVCVGGGCGGEIPEPPEYEPICVLHQSQDYKTPPPPQALADAEYIVRAVNSHAELLEACLAALKHTEELGDAWMRGSVHEIDGRGGERSNRNHAVEVALRAAIAKAETP